jgi:anti-sigma regulatory factor (Ser/Thr protein kinase)
VESAEFPARRDAFPRVRAFVEDACARAGVPRDDCLRLTLVVEELFVNTVVHGHGGDTDAPVRLALTMSPGAIAVCYEDTASPFNPFAMVLPPDDDDDVEERKVGGLGVRLIQTMAQDIGHASPGGGNRVTFRLARADAGADQPAE